MLQVGDHEFRRVAGLESKLARPHLELAYLPAADLSNPRRRGERQFIESILAVHHHRVIDPKRGQRLGHQTHQPRLGDAEQLATRTRWIAQRRNQVENGAHAERAPQSGQASEHRMVRGGEDETASGGAKASLHALGVEIDLHPVIARARRPRRPVR